jgi:citrate lyase subunit beta / citryl-CoA lyase
VAARRSCLSVPGSRPRFHEKADGSAADMVFFDLEDSVAPAAKEAAREQVVQALRTYRYEGKVRGVRVNSVDTRWCADDIQHVVEGAGDRLDCLVIPKVEDVDMVHFVHHLLNQLEMRLGLDRHIGLELQVESASGMENSPRIAAASPRNETLILGPVDFAASMGMPGGAVSGARPDYPGDLWHYFLARMAVAARASGLQAIDGPFMEVRDLEGLRASARRSAALGYDGKWVVHPDQAGVVNEVYSPSQEAFEQARRVVEAYRQATDVDGSGAVMLDAEMIDEASRKHATATLERGQAAGLTVH